MLAQVTLTVLGGAKDGSAMIVSDDSTCLIGRGHDCDLRLSRADGYHGVHPHHCLVEVDLPVVRVHELHRSAAPNGSFGNGHAKLKAIHNGAALLPESFDVSAGDEIRVGNAILQVGILIVTEDCPPSIVL